jgi:hypothetical protein
VLAGFPDLEDARSAPGEARGVEQESVDGVAWSPRRDLPQLSRAGRQHGAGASSRAMPLAREAIAASSISSRSSLQTRLRRYRRGRSGCHPRRFPSDLGVQAAALDHVQAALAGLRADGCGRPVRGQEHGVGDRVAVGAARTRDPLRQVGRVPLSSGRSRCRWWCGLGGPPRSAAPRLMKSMSRGSTTAARPT